MIAKGFKNLILVMFPDPTGGLVSSLVKSIIDEIQDILLVQSSSIDGIEKLVEVFLLNVSKAVTRYLLVSILKQFVSTTIFDQINQTVNSITGILSRVDELKVQYLTALYNLLSMIEHYSHYYPVLFSRIEVYDAKTLNSISWRGSLTDKFLFPLDKLTISNIGERGVIVFVKPYCVQELLLNVIGDLLRIDVLKQFKGQFMIHGVILAIASWSYYIGMVFNIDSLKEGAYNSLCEYYNSYFNTVVEIMGWVSIYGLGNDIGYPEVHYIPPTTI